MKSRISHPRLLSLILSTSQTASNSYGFVGTLSHHSYSIWLFLFSDLKTIVIPMAVFGTMNALSTLAFEIDQTDIPTTSQILLRIPKTVFWIISNLLPFLIDNQRHPKSILEDSMNKSWRPLPSKRLRPELAKAWMMVLYPTAIMISMGLGGWRQSTFLLFLGIWYNDFGGADVHYTVRNLINACGFVSYASGAMEIALEKPLPASDKLLSWFALIAVVVFTSVHSQDLPDQAGDRLCGRNSVPLALGEDFARWSIMASVLTFSVLCPLFWGSPQWALLMLVLLGATVSARTLTKRTVRDDKMTFRLWNLWMATIYSLPLIKSTELAFLRR